MIELVFTPPDFFMNEKICPSVRRKVLCELSKRSGQEAVLPESSPRKTGQAGQVP